MDRHNFAHMDETCYFIITNEKQYYTYVHSKYEKYQEFLFELI